MVFKLNVITLRSENIINSLNNLQKFLILDERAKTISGTEIVNIIVFVVPTLLFCLIKK